MTFRVRFGGTWGLLLLLAACELDRPKGNFDPDYDSGLDAGAVDATLPMLEASVGFFEDAGAEGGVVVVPPDNPELAELVGAYLVRVDEYSVARTTVNVPIPTAVEVKNRTSYLITALLTERDGALRWSERLCGESHEQDCVKGCDDSGTFTTVQNGVAPFFDTAQPTERSITLGDDGTLRAETHTLPLGFDARENSALPSSDSDPRVWNSGPTPSREGVYTQIGMKVGVASGRCDLSIVQQLTTAWAIPLKREGEAYVLNGIAGVDVDLSGTRTELLAAAEVPPALEGQCNTDGASGDPVREVISFAKVQPSDIAKCPAASKFDQLLPADPP